MKALEGITKTTFLGFFSSHIVFSIIVDSQAILPLSWIPTVLRDLLAFEVKTFNDGVMGKCREMVWFQAIVGMELCLQVPFFFAAVYLISQTKSGDHYPNWFRTACIVYGAHTATTLGPILATLITNPDASNGERAMVTSLYLPYLILPLGILQIAASSDPAPSTKSKSF